MVEDADAIVRVPNEECKVTIWRFLIILTFVGDVYDYAAERARILAKGVGRFDGRHAKVILGSRPELTLG